MQTHSTGQGERFVAGGVHEDIEASARVGRIRQVLQRQAHVVERQAHRPRGPLVERLELARGEGEFGDAERQWRRLRGLRFGRISRVRFGRKQAQQEDLAVRHPGDLDAARQRLDRAQLDREPRQLQHRIARGFLYIEIEQRQLAREDDGRRLTPGLGERDGEIGFQPPCAQLDRQSARHVFDVTREVEAVNVEVERRFVRRFERLGFGDEFDRRAVHAGAELRLDRDFLIDGQAGKERHRKLDCADRMLRALRTVVERDAAVDNFNVRERKARGRLVGVFRLADEFVDQVGPVVAVRVNSHYLHLWPRDADGRQHRREPEQGSRRCVRVQLFHRQCGSIAVAFVDTHVAQSHRQHIRIDAHRPDGDLAVQGLGELLFELGAHDERCDQSTQYADGGEGAENPPADFARAPRAGKCRGPAGQIMQTGKCEFHGEGAAADEPDSPDYPLSGAEGTAMR